MAKDEQRPAHFGTVMDLCNLKHAEMYAKYVGYKGRVVFRGDQVKVETGYDAAFSEHGTSASSLAAAKFLDAIVR